MNKLSNLIFLLSFIFISSILNAEMLTYDKVLKNNKANKDFKKENYEKATEQYQDNSIKHPDDGELHYNLGNALYKQDKLDEALAEYKMALRDNDFQNKSELYHNLGNVKFKQQEYKSALENYKKALQNDPQNLDARYNYEMAARYLQKQQQQQQQQNQDQENKDEKENKDQQNQQNSDQNKEQNEEQQKKQQQQNQDDQQKNEQQKQAEMKKAKDKKEAEQMLKALLAKEKEEMEKNKKKMEANKNKSGKYW